MIAGSKRWVIGFLDKNSFSRLVPVLVALFLLSACGYHFAGSAANKLSPGQSLWVSFIKIEIDGPSAQTVLRRALLEESHALRGLYPAGTAETADLRVNGNLRSYVVKTMSYSAQDQVKQFRLTIEVELELTRRGETTPVWKGTLQSFQDYPANSSNLALQRSSEEAALAAASHILAQKFLMAVEQAY
jgi:outer membrane lipopolysaccharide assembly protein LptE/RlpB